MKNTLISIIIPCYNNEKTITRAINSAVNQSYSNTEIICIDDGSIDNTLKILYKLADTYSNIEVLSNKKNRGPSYSRNKGVSKASGNLIAFLDADDYWHSEKLRIQIDTMSKYKYNFIGTQAIPNLNTDFFISLEDVKVIDINYFKLIFKNQFSTPTVLMEKKLFIPFDENQKYSEDYKLWLELITQKNIKMGKIIEPSLVGLDKFSYGVSGLSSKLWEMEKNELKNYWRLLQKGHILALITIPISFLKYIKRIFITYLRG